MKKVFSKIYNFIIDHPIITMIITGLVYTFIDGYKDRQWNFAGCFIVTIIIFCILAPFIRHAKAKKEKREDADYLAKQIAIQQDKIQNPDKYK